MKMPGCFVSVYDHLRGVSGVKSRTSLKHPMDETPTCSNALESQALRFQIGNLKAWCTLFSSVLSLMRLE